MSHVGGFFSSPSSVPSLRHFLHPRHSASPEWRAGFSCFAVIECTAKCWVNWILWGGGGKGGISNLFDRAPHNVPCYDYALLLSQSNDAPNGLCLDRGVPLRFQDVQSARFSEVEPVKHLVNCGRYHHRGKL